MHQVLARELGALAWYNPTGAYSHEEALFSAIDQKLIIGAVDTEFIPGGAREKPRLTEVGFSYMSAGGLRTNHFIIGRGKAKGKRKRFRYGYTQHFPNPEDLKPVLQQLYAKAEVILTWNGDLDLKMLASADCAPPKQKVLEISRWQRCPAPSVGYYRLAHFCELHGIQHVGQHNAGNDAYALLKSVLTAAGAMGLQGELEELVEVL